MSEIPAKAMREVGDAMVAELRSRRGFRQEFDGCDQDVQEEFRDDLGRVAIAATRNALSDLIQRLCARIRELEAQLQPPPPHRFGDLRDYGYAPGEYWRDCRTCRTQFDGDKRARNCRPCAEAAERDARAVGQVAEGRPEG